MKATRKMEGHWTRLQTTNRYHKIAFVSTTGITLLGCGKSIYEVTGYVKEPPSGSATCSKCGRR